MKSDRKMEKYYKNNSKDKQSTNHYESKRKEIDNKRIVSSPRAHTTADENDLEKAWQEFKKETGYKESKGRKESINKKTSNDRKKSFDRKNNINQGNSNDQKRSVDQRNSEDQRNSVDQRNRKDQKNSINQKYSNDQSRSNDQNNSSDQKRSNDHRKNIDQKKGFDQKKSYGYKDNVRNKNMDQKVGFRGKSGLEQKAEFRDKNKSDHRIIERRDKLGIQRTKKEDTDRYKKEVPINGACPHIRECGGCSILRQSYEVHLANKQKLVEDLLKKYGKVDPIIGMEQPKHYRNKVHVIFDHDRKGNPVSGVYEEGTHRVIPVESCLIHNQKADAIIATMRGMLKSFKILTYDEDTGYGLLRHVLIRTGFHSGEIMVVLVLASPILPSKNNFVKALLKQHPEITTVVVNVNDKRTSMVLGDKEQVIYGKGYIEDSLCSKTFRISPKSFYQVNPLQTEVVYGKAIEYAGLTGKETVIDAYCGIGTIGIVAAEKAAKVIGVELNKDAVRDAVMNAKLNGIKNIEFYQNDAGKFMYSMAQKGASVDVVFMDPPRSGSSEQFLEAVAALKPKKVVYISCNPVTLEQDLQYLTKKGYKAEKVVPVDMFPWTQHVETVCLMSRKDK